MKIPFLLITLSLCSMLSAQVPKFQMGMATGNLVTFTNSGFNENLVPGNLLRYKAGVLMRSRLTEKFKLPKPFPKVRKGVLALDYGMGVVARGYIYKYRGIEQYDDQWAIEVPLLLVMYDRSDHWLKRKMRRKGYATFARMGFRSSYVFPGKKARTLQTTEARLIENADFGGLNLYWSVGGGFLQTTKSGRTCSISISGNIGWFRRTKLVLNYEDDSGRLEDVELTSNGSYVDIVAIYLFNRKEQRSGRGKLPPVIFNPRF